MRKKNLFVLLGVGFLGAALVIFVFHYMIFGDPQFIFKHLFSELGFLPISVFLVTIVLNELMSRRDKRARRQKLDMIIGAFFSDFGNTLLDNISKYDQNLNQNRKLLMPTKNWSSEDFEQSKKNVAEIDFKTDLQNNSLHSLHVYLSGKRQQLLSYLESPSLLDYEHFSDLIWAIFHLQDELAYRSDLNNLTEADTAHLSEDMKRAYQLLIIQWLDYMQYLQVSYPYLYSLALRTNPFDSNARVEIG